MYLHIFYASVYSITNAMGSILLTRQILDSIFNFFILIPPIFVCHLHYIPPYVLSIYLANVRFYPGTMMFSFL